MATSEIDSRADIYSLGVIFYELIAGRKPFGGQTLAELRRGHVSFTPEPLHLVAPQVSEKFSQVVTRAISKDRNHRQSTAGELIQEARAALGLTASPSLAFALRSSFADPSIAGAAKIPARLTGVDLSAPTIVGDEADPSEDPAHAKPNPALKTAAPSSSVRTTPNAGAQRFAPPLPTIATGSGTTSEATGSGPAESMKATRNVAFSPVPAVTPVVLSPQVKVKKGGSGFVFMIAGVLGLLMLAGLGVGGWFAWNWSRGDQDPSVKAKAQKTVPVRNAATEPTPLCKAEATPAAIENQFVEVAQWWLDVAPLTAGPDETPERRASLDVKVGSKEKFKFNFLPRESGYLYIVGPDERGQLKTFLTAKPARDSGVTSNKVERDQLFSLNWMTSSSEGQERYHVVFASVPLETPEFFTGPALRNLSGAELSAWEAFLSQNKANMRTEAVKNGGASMMTVSSTRSAEGDTRMTTAPTVFEIVVSR
ncbi:MAG: hypothetical protein WKF84_08035 [Pyrinomonadaceae bacterium]